MKRMWSSWCNSPRQGYSLATGPLRRPTTAPWHRRSCWHAESVCHTGLAEHHWKQALLSLLCLPSYAKLSSTLALVCFLFPTWLPPPLRLSFLLFPPSLGPLVLSLSVFSYSPSWRHTFHLQSLPSSYDLSVSFCSPLYSILIFQAPSSHPCSFQPHSFPLAESPLISIWLPSACGEMKINSPSSNCFSLNKEKKGAVSWALSKAVHPSPSEVWRWDSSGISVALLWLHEGEALEQQRSKDCGPMTCSFSDKLQRQN